MTRKLIKIKIKMCNSINIYRYQVIIYDGNKLVMNNFTEFGEIQFLANLNSTYKIIIINPYLNIENKKVTIFVDNNCPNKFIIICNNCQKSKIHSITVKVTDKNYKDLPILKGKMILWNT